MMETTSQDYACLDCGKKITKNPRGGKKKYCADCALTRSRAAARDYQRRRRSGVKLEIKPAACLGCGSEFYHTRLGGQQPERCLDCREAHFVAYQYSYRRARGHLEIGTTVTLICACGEPFDWFVTQGRKAWKCQRCLDASYVQKMRRDSFLRRMNAPKPDLSRVCVDCDCGFEQRSVRSPKVKRCPSCAEARAARLRQEHYERYGAALVESRKFVYATLGRWSPCRGCGAQLANQRMGIFREWCDGCLPQRRRDVGKAWRLRNPEAAKALSFRANKARRALLANVVREPYERDYILDRDKWICQLCKMKILKKYTGRHTLAPSIDHQIPLELGGPDTPANVTAAHFGCNSAKRSRYMPKGEQLALVG